MPLTIPASTQLDLGTLVTNLGILAVAVAAVISGIYTGWQKVKKAMSGEEGAGASVLQSEGFRVLKASITETSSMTFLTESNRALGENVRQLDASVSDLVSILRANKQAAEGQAEEAHRLRIAIRDLYEQLRSKGVQ